MKKKIIVIFVCTLMIATALSATGTMNFQTTKLVNENNSFEPYLSTSANTGLITINIVAKVIAISDEHNILGGSIKVNDTITGKYTYDSGIPDSKPNNTNRGEYYFMSSSCGIELKSGGFVFKTNPSEIDFKITILNDDYYNGDYYVVYSGKNLQLSNGILVLYIILSFSDKSNTVFSSDALPTTAPDLADFDENILWIQGQHPSLPYGFVIWANVTKATKNRARDIHFAEHLVLIWLLERFQNMFTLLRQLMSIH